MKKRRTSPILTQIISLFICILLVHVVWASVIRPNARVVLEERKVLAEQDQDFTAERSIWVTLKDWEQESCVILMFWALALMGGKVLQARRERRILSQDLVKIPEGVSVLPEDAREYMRTVQSLPESTREQLLPRAVMIALQRFESTHAVQNASEAVRNLCDGEADRLDSELAMIRYITWAIPSIGFIGTVRGIGEALGKAYEAVQGNIVGVTESLGVAFNSTFVALVISIMIMFFVQQLQRYQEEIVIDTESWCDENLLRHLQVR
ncbi:MAG: MotA/TolQ/ExbB proton channel family protein [Gammaproteobacteria bacterium]|nr:MotA/TolQ/ExbB proton channel family protein [Gammaproteobacteria bacterium]MXX94893.1 MotA/TolQ/ExbB proton channel family protein [Gammaproteobacteria bacterium]MYF53734.1 MotA/TolQ/ExbB proton channel family protein [Gammaproteobacteria bacterium]MYK43799.1 MotA/TolQ/ExbB proton channel family protein [Gammaproteobacteria bacterium]